MKNPIIKKDGKYYNTLTKKYISEPYGKRLQSYYKRNPDSTLNEAHGHPYKLKLDKKGREKKIIEQPQYIKEVFFRKNQIVTSISPTGKRTSFNPFTQEKISTSYIKKAKSMDYKICGGKVNVSLYRLTRDNRNVYHVFDWKVNGDFRSPLSLEAWINSECDHIINSIIKHMFNVDKKHKIHSFRLLYGHIESHAYSDLDSYPIGISFGFVQPEHNGRKILKMEFDNAMGKILHKIELASYHMIYISNITLYIYGDVSNLTESIVKNRKGIIKHEKKKD